MIILFFVCFFIFLFLYMLVLAFQVNVKKHSLRLKEIKNGEQFHLFFISDIHRRRIPDHLINSLIGKVDIVVIGGDLTEKNVPLVRTEKNLKLLGKLGPIFYVYGNNDREVGEQLLNSLLEENDVCILRNSSKKLSKNNVCIRLVGINDGFSGEVRMYDAFHDVSPREIIVFVSHAPAFFTNAKIVSTPNLLLAGHLHGGQIRFGPFGIYENGEFIEKENCAELVSNGFGTTGVPLRLGAKSECHLITLEGKME